jgi:dipeptidyl aminopeptidase/acylaminoacyl peptidase
VRELFRLGLARPGQVGVLGTSYGGYSAWHLATHAPPELIAAAAPICGMTDLRLDYETTRPDLRPMTAEMMGGTPDEIPEKYWQRSPINAVDRIRIPLLIVQGLRDPNVTPANTRLIVERLQANQICHQLLEFADEGHGIVRPENQRRLFPQLAEFFLQALEPKT